MCKWGSQKINIPVSGFWLLSTIKMFALINPNDLIIFCCTYTCDVCARAPVALWDFCKLSQDIDTFFLHLSREIWFGYSCIYPYNVSDSCSPGECVDRSTVLMLISNITLRYIDAKISLKLFLNTRMPIWHFLFQLSTFFISFQSEQKW